MQVIREEKVKGGKSAVVITACLLLYKVRPYFFWSGIFLNNYFNAGITIIIGVIFFSNLRKLSAADKFLMFLLGMILVSYPFVGGQNFNVFVSIVPLLFLPFGTEVFSRKVLDTFTNIYCLLIGISLIVWCFALMGVLNPYKIIPPLNEIKNYNYGVYPLLVNPAGSFRFCGLFDEPGVVGTISALTLCCQQSFKSTKSIVLLISGICSFSLFFFVVVAVYFTYSQLLDTKKKSYGIFAFSVALAIGLIVITSSPVFSKMIGDRLSIDSDTGFIAGDNRTSDLAWEMLDSMVGTSFFWFGIDDKWEFQEQVAYSSSIINVIVMNGMAFLLMIVLFYFVYGWTYKSSVKQFLVYFFIVAGTLYQRPGIFNPEFIFLFTSLARKEQLLYNTNL